MSQVSQYTPEYPVMHLQYPSSSQHLLSQALSSDFVEPIVLHAQAKQKNCCESYQSNQQTCHYSNAVTLSYCKKQAHEKCW